MRVVSRLSTDSGSVSSRSPARAALTSSRTKSGLPPERSVSAASVSLESATSSAMRQRELGRAVGLERLEVEALDRVRRDARLGSAAGRVVTQTSHGRGAGFCGQVAEQEPRRVVEPVRVLEDEQRRHHQHALEERLDGLEQPVAARRRVERVGLRRRQHVRVERDREQRQPRREVGHHAGDERRELRAGLLARARRA